MGGVHAIIDAPPAKVARYTYSTGADESRRSSRSNARAIGKLFKVVSSITAAGIVAAPTSIVDDNVGALDALIDGQ